MHTCGIIETMNWLILAQDVQDKDLKPVENFLGQKNVDFIEAFLYDGLSREDLADIESKCLQVSHCIILGGSAFFENPFYGFVCGLLSGNNVQVFLATRDKALSDYEKTVFASSCKKPQAFSDVNALTKHLSENFTEISKIDVVHRSLVELITHGIPFTSDSFATAISKDNEKLCQLFVDGGMDVNARTGDGVPLICVATRSDCVSRVKWLLEKGADINAISNDRGYSAVMDAVWRKNFELTEFLVDKGADLSFVSSDGQPILVLAVGNGNLKIVELLLSHGADADKQDGMGMSARAYANLFKKPGMVELFEKYPVKEAQ